MKTPNQTPNQTPEPPQLKKNLDDIADEIVKVSNALSAINASRLTKRAIHLLIRDSITGNGMGLKDIEVVLDCAAGLAKRYIKP